MLSLNTTGALFDVGAIFDGRCPMISYTTGRYSMPGQVRRQYGPAIHRMHCNMFQYCLFSLPLHSSPLLLLLPSPLPLSVVALSNSSSPLPV